jgi:YVTN family beta-propeller protein
MAVIDYGTLAPQSVASGGNALLWLVSQRNGDQGTFFGIGMASGYQVEIVSPQSINDQISRYAYISDAIAWCYTDRGHEFYQITFPSANATWVYDLTTKLWHERSYYAGSPYVIGRALANCYVHAWDRHFVGSYLDGKIYEQSESFLTDDGEPIASVRVSTPISGYEANNIFISKLQLDMETGVGDVSFVVDENTVSETVAVGTNPIGIVSEYDNIWITNYSDNTVSKINRLTKQFLLNVSVGVAPTDIAFGDGYIWVCNSGEGTISKIDPISNSVVSTIIVTVFGGLKAMTYGGGYLLVCGGLHAYKVDPSSGNIISTVNSVSSPHSQILYGYDDAVWIASGSTRVYRIDFSSFSITDSISVGSSPRGIAHGGGYIWVANYTSGTVFKINVSTKILDATIAVGNGPEGIVYGNDGLVRVINSGDNTISIISPITNTVINIIPTLGLNPKKIILNSNAFWFTEYDSNDVEIIETVHNSIASSSQNPKALLSWSVDGGHTWSNDHAAPIGKLGDYMRRVIWRRLGCSRNRIFRIAISDPIKKVLIGAYMEMTGGAS